jgi:hypothetical protein
MAKQRSEYYTETIHREGGTTTVKGKRTVYDDRTTTGRDAIFFALGALAAAFVGEIIRQF